VQSIRAVDNAHEIYFHLLEVMVTTLALERSPPRNTCQVESLTNCNSADESIQDIPQPSLLESGAVVALDQLVDDEDGSTTNTDDVSGTPFCLSQPSRPGSPSISRAITPVRQFQIVDSDVGLPSTTLRLTNSPVAPGPAAWHRSSLDAFLSVPVSPTTEPPSSSLVTSASLSSTGNRDPYSWMTALQRDIVLYIAEAGPPISLYPSLHSQQDDWDDWDGAHVTEMARGILMRRHVTMGEFSDALDFLEKGGYIYTTVDDSHFKLTRRNH